MLIFYLFLTELLHAKQFSYLFTFNWFPGIDKYAADFELAIN